MKCYNITKEGRRVARRPGSPQDTHRLSTERSTGRPGGPRSHDLSTGYPQGGPGREARTARHKAICPQAVPVVHRFKPLYAQNAMLYYNNTLPVSPATPCDVITSRKESTGCPQGVHSFPTGYPQDVHRPRTARGTRDFACGENCPHNSVPSFASGIIPCNLLR